VNRDRVLRALRTPGAVVGREGGMVVVRAHGDRRRRPLLRLTESEYASAQAGPSLAAETVAPAESWQADEQGFNVKRTVNRAESPMAWLLRHKDAEGVPFLTRAHAAALEKLREDHLIGFAQPGLTSNWDLYGGGRGGGFRGDDPALFRLAARDRCRAALGCLTGDLRAVFERVCLDGTAISVVERGFGLPRRSGKHHVRAALDRLARYYGF